MKNTITVTSKGQVTIPAWARKELGVLNGGKLTLEVSENGQTIQLSKPVSFQQLQSFVHQQTTSKQRLPEDIHEWYENQQLAELKAQDKV